MSRTIAIAISEDDTIALAPLHLTQEGDDYLVGERGSKSYVVMQGEGAQVVRMLQEGATPAEIKQALRTQYAAPDLTLAPLLHTLVEAGFVRAVAGTPVGGHRATAVVHRPRVLRRHVAWLFGAPMIAPYMCVLVAGLAIVLLQPPLLASPRDIVVGHSYALTALVGLLISFVNVAKHEAAHVAAGTFLGIEPRVSLGHRLIFPVLQTDLTDLWSLPPRRRYIAYVAGMVSDLLAASGLLIVLWLAARDVLTVSPALVSMMQLGVVVIIGAVVWQLNLFMRTDVYYIVATALRCRDLLSDAKRFLRYRARLLIGRQPPLDAPVLSERERRVVPAFAVILVVGTSMVVLVAIAACIAIVLALFPGVQAAAPLVAQSARTADERVTTAVMLALSITLLGVSLVRNRRPRVTYRMIPADGL